jgi:hypothetical protein
MSIKSNVIAALKSAVSYAEAVEALKNDCKGINREEAREAMLPVVAAFYKVEVVEGKLSRESAKYEAAKKFLQRLLAEVYPSSASKEEVEIPAEILKAAKALAKLCSEYEGAKTLAAKALAKSFS